MLSANQKRDYDKYFIEAGDPGFSPEKNYAVINKTIREYEETRARKHEDWMEQLSERVDAVSSYFKHLRQGKFTDIETYFGRKFLSYLQGQKIVQKLKRLKSGKTIITLDEVM